MMTLPRTSRGTSPTFALSFLARSTIALYQICFLLLLVEGKLFESKSKKEARAAEYAKERERLANLFVIFGKYQLDKTAFYTLVSTTLVILVASGIQLGVWCRHKRDLQLKGNIDNTVGKSSSRHGDGGYESTIQPKRKTKRESSTLDVVIVGCGIPKEGVGWFHLMQFLEMSNTNVRVRAVVESYYLDSAKCPCPPAVFVDFVETMIYMGIECVNHVGKLEKVFRSSNREILCVIAGKTKDNPRFFKECIGMGATHIYLEVPGAPSIGQLKDMETLAETRGVEVYMGYQRLCSSYIERAVALSRSIPKSHIFFCHNENNQSKDLHLVVTRHSEGMLRSMASQELAVFVTQYGVTADMIDNFKVNTNRLFSEKVTFHNRANGDRVEDLARVAFKITTKKGKSMSVMADRCGGLVSFAVVKSSKGEEIQRFQSLDERGVMTVEKELKDDTEMMHQFVVESEDYLELKRRIVKAIMVDDVTATGVVSIHDGVKIMVLSDYCANEINAVLTLDS